MMALPRLLAPALAAALVSACGGSSVNEFASDKPQLAGPAPQSAASTVPLTEKAAGSREQEAVRKVALSVTAVSDPGSKAYKVGPLDVLEVTVFKVPELSRSVQVSEAGTINFPLIGEIQAGGKPAREIERELTKALGVKYLQNPQVTVFVKEYNSQRVTVEGAVKKPGVLPMAGGMSLLQAIAQSQGLEATAETNAVLFRTANGKRSVAKYDITAIRQGNADDPQLQAGDVIIVPTSDVKEGVNTVVKFLPLAMMIPLL
ncbi:MAG: polysaccharide biosynthesis/export family protein [Rhodomicrobium sp.]